MEPNSEPVNSNLPDPKPPDTNQTDIDQAKPITDPKVLYPNDVLALSLIHI